MIPWPHAMISRPVHDFDPDAVALPSGSLVGGRLQPGSGPELEVLRPSDGRPLFTARSADNALVDEAVTLAARTFETSPWATFPAPRRAKVLRRWAALIQERGEELARIESVGSTRIITETRNVDVPMTIRILNYYAALIEHSGGEVLPSSTDVWRFKIREPIGVVAAITPWNAPLLLATMKLAPAIAAGNAVVMKPSELTPHSIVRLVQLAIEAGIPAGQIAVVCGVGTTTGPALVTHPLVNAVGFTGSGPVGARVAADAATAGPRAVSLELGGKSPQVVFADANIRDVAEMAAAYVCRNGGQSCWAGTRVIAHESVVDELTERIIAAMGAFVPGPTWSVASKLSPIVSEKQATRIEDIVRRAVAEGADIVTGGKRVAAHGDGIYYQPTLVRRLTRTNPVLREEVFGPVLSLQTFREADEGIAMANDSPFALAAGVHTKDLQTAMRCVRQLQAGVIWVNDYGRLDPVMPFGGFKQSGFGKDLGTEALHHCMRTKSVSIKV
jgi:aldehyde dehydrogenase (NAD+)